MNILVIAPHPDDEVLGCGATLAKYAKNGDQTYICYVTKAYTPDWSEEYIASRVTEIKKANEALGVKGVFFLDFPTCKLDNIPKKELNDSLSRIVKKVEPDIVYVPYSGDLHQDHGWVHRAALIATRPYTAPSVKRILCYETPSETEWGLIPFVPNVYEDVDGFIKAKVSAIRAYASEVKLFPHPRSPEVLTALATKRGSEAGIKAAEAFMLVREIA